MKPLWILVSLVLALPGCSMESGTAAVILWAPGSGILAEGTPGTVQDRSSQNKTLDFQSSLDGSVHTLESWRVRVFSQRAEADNFLSAFQPLRRWFAVGRLVQVILRESPDPGSPRKSPLPGRETLKVLGRLLPPEDPGMWWYEVLAPGGLTGWVPEDELEVVEHTPGLVPSPIPALTRDPLLEEFFREVWRPAELGQQISLHLVDPDNLKDDHLLRAFREDAMIQIFHPKIKKTYPFTQVRKLPDRTYAFEGTDLKIRFHLEPGQLTVYVPLNGQVLNLEFRTMQDNLGDMIARERARNREIYRQLWSLGPVLRSPGQGELYLEQDQSFLWLPSPLAGRNGLRFFQKDYGNRGQVRILLHLGDSLRSAGAQGVISLVFEPAPDSPVHFVYRMERGGIQLWQAQPPLPGVLRIDTMEPGTPSYFFSFSRT